MKTNKKLFLLTALFIIIFSSILAFSYIQRREPLEKRIAKAKEDNAFLKSKLGILRIEQKRAKLKKVEEQVRKVPYIMAQKDILKEKINDFFTENKIDPKRHDEIIKKAEDMTGWMSDYDFQEEFDPLKVEPSDITEEYLRELKSENRELMKEYLASYVNPAVKEARLNEEKKVDEELDYCRAPFQELPRTTSLHFMKAYYKLLQEEAARQKRSKGKQDKAEKK